MMGGEPFHTDRLTPFGRYYLAGKLASGGMGEIYLAKQKGAAGFEKRIVIKKILPHLCQDKAFVERLIDEGKLLVHLNHGNIVPVIDLGVVNGEYYLAMEYVHGEDLRGLLRKATATNQALPVPLAVFILAEVCKGLSYAHHKCDENGDPLHIVHRDISPSNIMISREGAVKILDFGIAKARDRLTHSVTGSLHGKFMYMSPEQARGLPVDQRSDLFSLGVVAYEILSGVRPFSGDTEMEVLEKVKNFDPPRLRQILPALSPDLETIVARCLQKDLEKRYDSAESLGRDFARFLYAEGMPVGEVDLAVWVRHFIGPAPSLPRPRNLDEALRIEVEQRFGPPSDGFEPTRTRDAEPLRSNGVPSLPTLAGPNTATATVTASRPVLAFMVVIGVAVVALLAFNVLYLFGFFDSNRSSASGADSSAAGSLAEGAKAANDATGRLDPRSPTTMRSDAMAMAVSASLDAGQASPRADIIMPNALSSDARHGEAAIANRRAGTDESSLAAADAQAGVSVPASVPDTAEHHLEKQDTRTVTIVVDRPATVEVFDRTHQVRKRCDATRRCPVRVEAGETLEAHISAPGFEPLVQDVDARSARLTVALQLPQYEVRFRFLPAYAQVFLDGRRRPLGGKDNLVSLRLPAGEHQLEVRAKARSERRGFRIEEGQQGPLNLGTIVVVEDDATTPPEPVGRQADDPGGHADGSRRQDP